jgi:hypothetical protein
MPEVAGDECAASVVGVADAESVATGGAFGCVGLVGLERCSEVAVDAR